MDTNPAVITCRLSIVSHPDVPSRITTVPHLVYFLGLRAAYLMAALKTKFSGVKERRKIGELIEVILPALEGIDPSEPPDQQWRHAVEANVRWASRQLAATPAGAAALKEGRIELVG